MRLPLTTSPVLRERRGRPPQGRRDPRRGRPDRRRSRNGVGLGRRGTLDNTVRRKPAVEAGDPNGADYSTPRSSPTLVPPPSLCAPGPLWRPRPASSGPCGVARRRGAHPPSHPDPAAGRVRDGVGVQASARPPVPHVRLRAGVPRYDYQAPGRERRRTSRAFERSSDQLGWRAFIEMRVTLARFRRCYEEASWHRGDAAAVAPLHLDSRTIWSCVGDDLSA